MFFSVFFIYIAFTEQPYRLSAPLSAVCTTYAKLFKTTEFTGDEHHRFEQNRPIIQLLDIPQQEFDNVPQIETLTFGAFMELYMAQAEYCSRPDVASLAQQVADGTHPHTLQIWETSLLEMIAVYSELSSEKSNDGRRKLVTGAIIGASAVGATVSEASAGTAAIEVVGAVTIVGEGATLIAFAPVVLLVAGVAGAIYAGTLACKGNHRRSLQTLRRILNGQMKAQTGLTIPSEDLMLACTDGLQSFFCNMGIAFIAKAMTTAVCGGVATGLASCVFDFAIARDLLAIGDGN